MNYNIKAEERWSNQKAKLKLLYVNLDDEDLRYDYGMKDIMMTKLQVKLGKSREELEAVLSGL